MELQRRKWPTLEVGPLEAWRKRDIVEAFLKRSLAGRRRSGGQPPLDSWNKDGKASETAGQESKTFLTGVDFFLAEEGMAGCSSSLSDDAGAGEAGITGEMGPAAERLAPRVEPRLVLFPSMIESIISRCADRRCRIECALLFQLVAQLRYYTIRNMCRVRVHWHEGELDDALHLGLRCYVYVLRTNFSDMQRPPSSTIRLLAKHAHTTSI